MPKAQGGLSSDRSGAPVAIDGQRSRGQANLWPSTPDLGQVLVTRRAQSRAISEGARELSLGGEPVLYVLPLPAASLLEEAVGEQRNVASGRAPAVARVLGHRPFTRLGRQRSCESHRCFLLVHVLARISRHLPVLSIQPLSPVSG